jgi:hypothetical protein
MQEALFYGFSLERHVPDDHLLRKIDRFVDLSGVRAHLGPYYSDVGRPSVDPELMMRMLIVGYCFGIRSERRLCEEVQPSRLVADASYGSAEMLGWLVDERGMEPHVKVFDKSERTDGTFSRGDFAYDAECDLFVCPGGKELRKRRRLFSSLRSDVTREGTIIYRASKLACDACALKFKCCPNMPARKIARSLYEAARDKARASCEDRSLRCLTPRTEEGRDALRSPEANPEARPATPARTKRRQR